MTRHARKPGLTMALGLAMALTGRAGFGWQEPSVTPSVSRGARLFDGTEPLAGTLSGHSAPLPAAATRSAHVVLPRAMPRFEVDDVQCAALWDYLTQEVRS
jgi:hypothetical protein